MTFQENSFAFLSWHLNILCCTCYNINQSGIYQKTVFPGREYNMMIVAFDSDSRSAHPESKQSELKK